AGRARLTATLTAALALAVPHLAMLGAHLLAGDGAIAVRVELRELRLRRLADLVARDDTVAALVEVREHPVVVAEVAAAPPVLELLLAEVTVAVRVERVEAFTRHPRHLLTRELPIRVAVHGGEAIGLHRLAVRSRLLARHLPVAVGVDGVEAFERAL